MIGLVVVGYERRAEHILGPVHLEMTLEQGWLHLDEAVEEVVLLSHKHAWFMLFLHVVWHMDLSQLVQLILVEGGITF